MKKKIVLLVSDFLKKIPLKYQLIMGAVFLLFTMFAISFVGERILWILGTVAFFAAWVSHRLSLSEIISTKWLQEAVWWVSGPSFLLVLLSYHLKNIAYPAILVMFLLGGSFLIFKFLSNQKGESLD